MAQEMNIPDKMYFRIGEVAGILAVKPYVLRYWETEFPDIKPFKSKSGQRLYKRRDVELLTAIKSLLYDEKFTINGARQHLKALIKEPREDEVVVHRPKAQTLTASSSGKSSDGSKKVLLKVRDELKWCLTELRK